ncbi:LamG domain-containing protein [Novosphingobium sp.]|uniref:LamG domain-containing protein n=1 Tax=Novosphingobium sp. TaxID=1874826 RepID=UPI0031D65379
MLLNRRGVMLGGAAMGLMPKAALAAKVSAAQAPTEWHFDNLDRIGGHAVKVLGQPGLTTSPWGPAIVFDGAHDALLIDNHPLAGAKTFTFEAQFRPDGGAFAQRWFHLESILDPAAAPGASTTRMLFELRVADGQWYLDAFATGPGYKQTLIVPGRRYPLGQWYHVAQSFDGQHYRSFVNGELQMETPLPFAPQGPGRCSVGARLNGVDHFHGAIRMARFSPYAAM